MIDRQFPLDKDALTIMNESGLNYLVTKIIHNYLGGKGIRYRYINEVVGVLECVKQELYRVIASVYESKKKLENGSVSDLDRKYNLNERLR